MLAPDRFVQWLANNPKADKHGNVYHYHSRSDAHSIALCKMVMEDILEHCPVLRQQARDKQIVYGINFPYVWASGKTKTLDLAIGPAEQDEAVEGVTLDSERPALPDAEFPLLHEVRRGRMADLYLSCEAKAVMTEHSKSKPRLYDELSSSHEIIHQGSPNAIAAGIATVNVASTFVSPLRNKQPGIVEVTQHTQPKAAGDMIRHLRQLPVREMVGSVGFDAYCTFAVDVDNQTTPRPWTEPPAPQPGDPDHYLRFLDQIVTLYAERFSTI